MSERDDGGPAFPRAMSVTEINADPGAEGMSLRDYFAGKTFAAYMVQVSLADIVNKSTAHGSEIATLEEYASTAYRLADAMLRAKKAEVT